MISLKIIHLLFLSACYRFTERKPAFPQKMRMTLENCESKHNSQGHCSLQGAFLLKCKQRKREHGCLGFIKKWSDPLPKLHFFRENFMSSTILKGGAAPFISAMSTLKPFFLSWSTLTGMWHRQQSVAGVC